MIPSAVQQIISVDYRALRDSPSARALKDRVLPDNLKQFETALKGAGIDPDKDVEQLTFVSYRPAKGGLRSIGIAQGPFKQKEFLQKMRLKKIKPEKYLLSYLYPMGSGMQLVFLDPITILFGENAAIKGAIDVRDNGAESLESNNTIDDLITSVDSSPMWSVLDQAGTQNMMRSALGAGGVAGRLRRGEEAAAGVGLRHELRQRRHLRPERQDLRHHDGGDHGLAAEGGRVVSQDERQLRPRRLALENTTVDNSHDMLQMHFKTDDQRFQALLKSDLFAAVSK